MTKTWQPTSAPCGSSVSANYLTRCADATLDKGMVAPGIDQNTVPAGHIPLNKLLMNQSIVDAVRKYNVKIADEIAYDWEFDDDELLPLNRMDKMMSTGGDRPPIDIERRGRLYSVLNGRHRVARAFLLGEKSVATGHEDFIVNGGESNPGPKRDSPVAAAAGQQTRARLDRPARQPKQEGCGHAHANRKVSTKSAASDKSGGSKSDTFSRQSSGGKRGKKTLEAAVSNYRLSNIYTRGLVKYRTPAGLEKFNDWVALHINEIDPSLAQVCHVCGNADLILCEHNVAEPTVEQEVLKEFAPAPVLSTEHFWSFHLWDSIKRSLNWPKFDIAVQNNTNLAGFENGDIPDENIIPELYNYVKLRMQSSYSVNGKESRPLRLEHCRRLASKWLESRKMEKAAEESTILTNRIMFTTQRVCDNTENSVMYGETDPNQNFLLARLPILKSWPKLLIGILLYALYGRIIMFALPHLILFASTYIVPGAAAGWANLFIAMCRLLLSGSQHVFLGLIISPFTSIGVISLLIAAITTFLFSIRQTR